MTCKNEHGLNKAKAISQRKMQRPLKGIFLQCSSETIHLCIIKNMYMACRCSAGSYTVSMSTIYAKRSETIHGKIRVDKNPHSFSLPSSGLRIWWSRMTGVHTLFGINLNGNCSQRCSVLARSSSLNVLAHDSINKEAKINSPRVTESLSAAAGDGPLSRPFPAGTLCS